MSVELSPQWAELFRGVRVVQPDEVGTQGQRVDVEIVAIDRTERIDLAGCYCAASNHPPCWWCENHQHDE